MSIAIVPGVIGIVIGSPTTPPVTPPPTNPPVDPPATVPPGTVPDYNYCEKDSPIVGFHVLGSDNCLNTLRWCLLDNFESDEFQIYKSFTGFVTANQAPFGLSKGDALKLKINNQKVQSIRFDREYAIGDLIDLLNEGFEGLEVSKKSDSDQLIFRSKLSCEDSFIEVFGGSALSKMGLTKGTYSQNGDFSLWATVTGDTSEYADPDGDLNDLYYITNVKDSNIYKNTTIMGPSKVHGEICVIEGFLYSLNGTRVADVEVRAKIVCPPENYFPGGYIQEEYVSYLTDESGRFSLPVLRGAKILFEIHKARVSDPVQVPGQPFVFFDELDIYGDYKFQDINS